MRTLAHHYMIGKDDQDGRRIVIPEVRDYFLSPTQASKHPVITAEVLEWLNDPGSALEVLALHLSEAPNDWDATRIIALIHQRMGNGDRAFHYAQLLPSIAAWRAESYDWLSYVCERINKPDLATQAKKQGDEIFGRESVLFEGLRNYLDT
jgi:hypothetical protein